MKELAAKTISEEETYEHISFVLIELEDADLELDDVPIEEQIINAGQIIGN